MFVVYKYLLSYRFTLEQYFLVVAILLEENFMCSYYTYNFARVRQRH